MKYSGFLRNMFRPSVGLRHVLAAVLLTSTVLLPVVLAAGTETEKPSDNIRNLLKKAERLTRSESLTEAEALLRRAIEIDPAQSAAKIELAFVLTKQRRLLDAYNLLVPVVEADRKNARAMSVFGALLLAGGRFREARAVFFNAIKLDKEQDLAWAGYGMLDFYENKIDDSLANLREAVFQEPAVPDYQFALGQVSARAEKYNEAAEAYKQFLRISSNTDKDRRSRINSLIDFLTFLGQRDGLYRSIGSDSTQMPFELVGNRPVIKVRINGHDRPLRFVLDTGSGITVISDDTARELKLKPVSRGGFAKGIGGDGKFEIVYGFLRQMEIGDLTIRNVPVYMRSFHQSSQNIDGYIGLSLISKFLTTVDYGSKTFGLTKREKAEVSISEENSRSLPLRLTSSGFLSGEVQLEGIDEPLNFIVDTGASVSVISDRVASNEGIVPYANDEKLRVIGAAGITEAVPTFMLPKVTFGEHSRTRIVAIALDLDIINEASGFEQAGILGGNFLKNYRLTFDFRNSKVNFTSVVPEN